MQAGNVLLHNNDVVKLTGFQFCRTMEQIKKTGVKKTVNERHFKWMDPQALRYQSVSPETVSWSFGVFLYELFTLGCVPFNNPEFRPEHGDFKREPLSAHEARIFIIRGGTLRKESCIPESIFSIISERCLQMNRSFRASPRELKELLQRQLIDDSKLSKKLCLPPPKLILEKEDYNPGNYNPGINAYDHDFPYAHLDVVDHSWNKEYRDQEFEEAYVNADPSESEPFLCIIKRQDKDHEYKEIRVMEYMEFKDIKLVEKLQKLNCPELVTVLAVNPFGPDRLEMITESLVHGNVFDAMLKKRELREHLRTYVRQAGSAVMYLHDHGIVHRNLKAENYLMVSEQRIKLGRLGMSMEEVDVNAEYSDPRMARSNIVPDARRNAPEVLKYGCYSRESDVWSFGIVVWELSKIANCLPDMDLDREDVMPYNLLTDNEVLRKVTNKKLMVINKNPDPSSSHLYDVYKQCWKWDAENRPSISTVIITLDLKFKLLCPLRRALPSVPQAFTQEIDTEPVFNYMPTVNSKRDISQSNQNEEELYEDVGSYKRPSERSPFLSKPDVSQSDTTGNYYSPVCDDDISTLSNEDISSLPNKQLADKPSCLSHASGQETPNTDEGLEEGTYEEVVIKRIKNENADTTGHYYSPVCDDDAAPTSSLQNIQSSPNEDFYENKENTKTSKRAVAGPEQEVYGEVVNGGIENTNKNNDTTEYNYSPVCDDEGPILSQGEIVNSASEPLADEISDHESAVDIYDDVTEIALNIGSQGHVQSVLARFYSLNQ